jgi:hypothetical protein
MLATLGDDVLMVKAVLPKEADGTKDGASSPAIMKHPIPASPTLYSEGVPDKVTK